MEKRILSSVLLGTAVAGLCMEMPLTPEKMYGVEMHNGTFAPAYNLYRPDAANRILMEAATPSAYAPGTLRNDEDSAKGYGMVTNLDGKYLFEVRTPGAYALWCRLKAPWSGTWVYSVRFEKEGAETKQEAALDLPKGFTTAFESGQGSALEREAHFGISREQEKKAVYVRDGVFEFEKGFYRMIIKVPGAILVDQLILAPVAMTDPQKSFQANGRILTGKPDRMETCSVHFAKVSPPGLEQYSGLQYQSAGEAASHRWFYRFPETPSTPFQELKKDSLAGDAQKDLPLELKLELYPRKGKPSPLVMNPKVGYRKNDANLYHLKTDSTVFEISKNGYWGGITTADGKITLRGEEFSSLPFRITLRNDQDQNAWTLSHFRAVKTELRKNGKGWIFHAEYRNPEKTLNVSLTGKYESGDAVAWNASIVNNTGNTVSCFEFPILNGLQIGTPADDNLAWTGISAEPMTELPDWLRKTPGQLTWFDLYDKDFAFYTGVHDASMRDVIFNLTNGNRPPFRYSVETFCAVPPGKRAEFGAFVIAGHKGDWRDAADRFYRPWYRSAMPKPDNPAWLRNDFSGSLQVVGDNFDPAPVPANYQIARFFGWNSVKAYLCRWPGPNFNSAAATFESVGRNVGWVRKQGGFVDSYTDMAGCELWQNRDFALYQSMKKNTQEFPYPTLKERLDSRFITDSSFKDANAVKALPNSNYWPRLPYNYRMCLNNDWAKNYWGSIAERYAKAGLHLYWDEAGNAFRNRQCCSPRHTHVHNDGGGTMRGIVETAKEMYRRGRKQDPDFIMSGENYNDRVMSVVSLPYLQDDGRKLLYGEIPRYTHPSHIQMAAVIKNRDFFREAFLQYLRITSSDIFNGPGMTPWLRARMALMKLTSDVAYPADYRSRKGLNITGNSLDARLLVLNRDGRRMIVIPVSNPAKISDGKLSLLPPEGFRLRNLYSHTLENNIRRLPFREKDGLLEMTPEAAELSVLLLHDTEPEDRQLRLSAHMPFTEGKECRVKVNVLNLSERPFQGTVRLNVPPGLRFRQESVPLKLAAGEGKTLEFPFTGRDSLQDFVNVGVECGAKTAEAIIAPTVPNGGFEIDYADNAQADYWKKSLRDFAEPFDGNYCMVIPPEKGRPNSEIGAFDPGRCPYFMPEISCYLLPGRNYTLRWRSRYAGKTPLKADVVLRDLNNRILANPMVWIPGDLAFQWKTGEIKFRTPENLSRSVIRFVNHDKTGNGVNAWIDQVTLTEE